MKILNTDIGNNFGGIYCITCNINSKPYIGQSVNPSKRLLAYSKVKCSGQPKIYKALKKYGVENFTFEVIDVAVDKIQLNFLEKLYIQKFDAINNGYNCSDGGDGGPLFKDHHHREDSKEKIRKVHTGKTHTEEHNKKITETLIKNCRRGENHPQFGKPSYFKDKHHKSETIELLKKPKTEEHKRKLSEALMGKPTPKISGDKNYKSRKVLCITTGEIFTCIKYAIDKYPSATGISVCCRGKCKSAGTLHDGIKLQWKYL